MSIEDLSLEEVERRIQIVEDNMRELMEQGFEVAVVSDATAAAIVEEGNGYDSALVNFRFIANTVWTTEEAVQKINEAK